MIPVAGGHAIKVSEPPIEAATNPEAQAPSDEGVSVSGLIENNPEAGGDQVIASDDLSVTANPDIHEQPAANDENTAVLPDEKGARIHFLRIS